MDTNITKTWTIEINQDEVFARCTNESLYQAYNRHDENPKGDAIVIQEDDKGQFKRYYDAALAGLQILLARRMGWHSTCEHSTIFELHMHDNHDDNILPVLINHCYEYVIKKVLEQWYHVDFGSEIERLEINHCIHYRKHPVRRRVMPMP